MTMAGLREPDHCGKICVDCGAAKTPVWRCNVDGGKSLCNRCGVRLYRKQKRAQRTDDNPSPNNDGWDDSSSCTNIASNIATADSQADPASWKRWGAQQAPSRAPQQDATSLGVRNAVGLAGQPVLPSNGSFRDKRMRSSAWPALAKISLEHLWEAGLDPLDPLFLANIDDPTALAAQDEVPPSKVDSLTHPTSCYLSDERFPSPF